MRRIEDPRLASKERTRHPAEVSALESEYGRWPPGRPASATVGLVFHDSRGFLRYFMVFAQGASDITEGGLDLLGREFPERPLAVGGDVDGCPEKALLGEQALMIRVPGMGRYRDGHGFSTQYGRTGDTLAEGRGSTHHTEQKENSLNGSLSVRGWRLAVSLKRRAGRRDQEAEQS